MKPLSRIIALTLFAAVLLAPQGAWAWWGTGHMLVAEIAYRRLNPHAKAEVDHLLAIDALPESGTFVTAACWPDDLKAMGVHAYDEWHYVDVPFTTDGTTLPTEMAPENVEWAIDQCLRTLRSAKAPYVEKARMLRFLIHFVGDVHQPLHCVSRYTQDHPDGDRGGNLFPLQAGAARNLHAYWDSGAGEFADIERPLTTEGSRKLAGMADAIIAAWPVDKLPTEADTSVKDWVQEGVALCKSVVYTAQPGAAPTDAYAAAARAACRRQVALAGYRLSDVLNKLYP
jgi:hypothetical protein